MHIIKDICNKRKVLRKLDPSVISINLVAYIMLAIIQVSPIMLKQLKLNREQQCKPIRHSN